MLETKNGLAKGSKKLINAWAFYDWANSVYSLVISSAIFPIYYAALFAENNQIDFFGYDVKNTAMISFVTGCAFLVVAFISPLLSGIADFIGNKKRFMQFFVYLGSFSCVGLYWFQLESIYLGLFFYFLAMIGLWASLVFYNSYLPDVAYPEQQDRASARGYSMGYIGSVLLLLFNLSMVMKPELYGIEGTAGEAAMLAMRYSFVSVGVWWFLFSQLSLYFLPKGNKNNEKITRHILWNGFRELRTVYKQMEGNFPLKRYLTAFFVYSLAVQTVMLVAAYFGEEEIAWGSDSDKTMGLIVSILLIQIVAIFGSILAARASVRFGNIPTLIVINVVWAIICAYAFTIETPIQFYYVAGFVGLVMGAIQSSSRAAYSKFLPETDDTTSYFSFYDVAEKVGIIIGMFLFGAIDQITGSMRYSIVFFGVFFVFGAIMLLRVNRKAAIL
ncbi:MFS transporter [Flavobacteriaceae bacterium]|jgi:UMF1 family MFS transporter|nr:MFS transporter [Flavobacteriaceae bacterium]MDB9941566.1 MFS transporter [Flavobacteriaceae bacterium]MDC1434102.1 MFS transporter [Flavobacteriaceae bacterium]